MDDDRKSNGGVLTGVLMAMAAAGTLMTAGIAYQENKLGCLGANWDVAAAFPVSDAVVVPASPLREEPVTAIVKNFGPSPVDVMAAQGRDAGAIDPNRWEFDRKTWQSHRLGAGDSVTVTGYEVRVHLSGGVVWRMDDGTLAINDEIDPRERQWQGSACGSYRHI